MNAQPIIYRSEKSKSSNEVLHYSKTHQSAHRYLAYRDLPFFISKYVRGKTALDYGTGVGFSAQLLVEQGFDVTGVDVSKKMIEQAQKEYPNISFRQVKNQRVPKPESSFDLVFSSFVLFELSSKEKIIRYLTEAKRVMKDDGVFIGITGSEGLYDTSKNWMTFRTQFPENENLKSGNLVKLHLNGANIEFSDYYWSEADYIGAFQEADLELLEIHYPTGKKGEPYIWKGEMKSSPFVVFVAKKMRGKSK